MLTTFCSLRQFLELDNAIVFNKQIQISSKSQFHLINLFSILLHYYSTLLDTLLHLYMYLHNSITSKDMRKGDPKAIKLGKIYDNYLTANSPFSIHFHLLSFYITILILFGNKLSCNALVLSYDDNNTHKIRRENQ